MYSKLLAKTDVMRVQAEELVRLRHELDLAYGRAEEAAQKN